MISYDEHASWLARQIECCDAEYHGFIRARIGVCLQWSQNPQLQARFEQGYRDGQAKLKQDLTAEGKKE